MSSRAPLYDELSSPLVQAFSACAIPHNPPGASRPWQAPPNTSLGRGPRDVLRQKTGAAVAVSREWWC